MLFPDEGRVNGLQEAKEYLMAFKGPWNTGAHNYLDDRKKIF